MIRPITVRACSASSNTGSSPPQTTGSHSLGGTARASCVASRPALPARASASSWLKRSTVLKKRTRASRSRTQFAPIAIARCVLPEPVPPTMTALRLPARKSPRCRSRTSAAFTGEAAKSNSPSAFHREPRLAHPVGRGPALHVGELRRQEVGHDPLGPVLALGRQRHDLVVGRAHAAQLQLDHQLEDGVALHHPPPVARSPS